MGAKEVVESLNSSVEVGISGEEAKERAIKYGKNSLPKVKGRNPIVAFLLQFHNALVYVLLAAGVLTATMAIVAENPFYWIETGVIFGVVLINCIIGLIQEIKAQRALDGISKMLKLKAMVIREGKRLEIDAEDITIGDIVLFKAGDSIPCDLRLVDANRLEVDESALTGESMPIKKQVEAVEINAPLGDRKSMVYASGAVRTGNGIGVAVAIGNNTEVGKINSMLARAKPGSTPLTKKMNFLGLVISIAVLILSVLLFFVAFFGHNLPWQDTVLAIIGLAVAAIPEGLPAIVTIILAVGVRRMAQRKAIVKTLPSAETLGSVTVICSDKTGTLTKNEMTATNIYTKEGDYEVSGAGYAPEGEIRSFAEMEKNSVFFEGSETFFSLPTPSVAAPLPPLPKGRGIKFPTLSSSPLTRLLQCACLCNDSGIKEENGIWSAQGSATEAALLVLAMKGEADTAGYKKTAEIPFDSEFKYRAAAFSKDNENIIFVNGAPEQVLKMCSLQTGDEQFWLDKMQGTASKGQRMIGLAYRQATNRKLQITKEDLQGLIFLGIVGIIDPPKQSAIDAIRQSREAGIRVKMITGDHALTAKEIARQMGLSDNDKVLTGVELENLSDDELKKVVLECDIYARTTPEHKLRLVKALQQNGEIVAMTGDGVNDAPALKQANIGVAMGIKGTEVTKMAAAMVLVDDNFETIVDAVKQGRTIYDNIQKSLQFALPANGAQGLVIILALIAGLTLPIGALQILWINMVVAVTLALSLSFEPTESSVMLRPPRNPKGSIITKVMLWRIIFVSIVIAAVTAGSFYLLNYSIDVGAANREAHASTFASNTIAIVSAFFLLSARKLRGHIFTKDFFKNKIVFIVIAVLIALQMGFTYIPFMNTAFSTAPLGIFEWLAIFGIGVVLLGLFELEKLVVRRVLRGKSKSKSKRILETFF